jgi:hypothetical protein
MLENGGFRSRSIHPTRQKNITFNCTQAKTHLSRLLELVTAGEEIGEFYAIQIK